MSESHSTRRDVLRAGGAGVAGIAAMSLPDAARASTYVGPASGAVTYGSGDRLLAGWPSLRVSDFNNKDETGGYPSFQGRWPVYMSYRAPADGGNTQLLATHTYGGSEAASFAALGIRGLVRDSGLSTPYQWRVKNADPVLDITAPGAPYLEWRLTAGSQAIRFASFFLSGALSAQSLATPGKISVRTSINGYATALRESPGPVGTVESHYMNYVVNLSGMPILEASQTVTIRLYFYGTGSSESQYFALFDTSASGRAPFVPGIDEYSALQATGAASGKAWASGFIGDYVAS